MKVAPPKDDDDYLMRDSLSPSNFEQARKVCHQRAGTQVPVVEEAGILDESVNQSTKLLLPNSEIKVNKDTHSNQSSVARFGLQGLKSSHGAAGVGHHNPKKLSFSISKGSHPPQNIQSGRFDTSQRSTMQQVYGPQGEAL
jgi:hypothetical protein